MKIGKALVGLTAMTLVAAPVAAQAAEAAQARVSSAVEGESMAGSTWVVVFLALIASGLGAYAALSGSDEPVSP